MKKIAQKQIGKLPLVGAGAQASDAMAANGGFQTVLTDQVSLHDSSPGVLLVNGALEVHAEGFAPSVDVRVLVNGQQEGGTFSTSMIADGTGTVPVSIQCDGLIAGTHTVEVQAQGPTGLGVSFRDRSLNAAAMPGI